MTAILGLSAFYHDAAAALVVDGRVVSAAQQERFSRVKNDPGFPHEAVAWCLRSAGLTVADLDHVAFYEKPLVKLDRLLETQLAAAPGGLVGFVRALPGWLAGKLDARRKIERALGPELRAVIGFADHHVSHAAAAFFPSPFASAAIVTADGVGEWSTTTLGHGRDGRIELQLEQRFPHSLGLLYSAFTAYLGFEVNEGEYKVMGLAPYGEPRFAERILSELVDLKDDGSFRLELGHFDWLSGRRMTTRAFERLFEGPARPFGAPIGRREMDLAASIQLVAEEVLLRLARTAHVRTGESRLCLAGGCAHNSVAVGRILREGPFGDVWVQPAAGDAGGAVGAALWTWCQVLGAERHVSVEDAMAGALLGPELGCDEIRGAIETLGLTAVPLDEPALLGRVAAALDSGRIVGWFQGRMELGPRALGARSILADARDPAMRDRVNRLVKQREEFRPFAPSVLRERAADWFEVRRDADLPYMTVVAPVRPERRGAIPAVTHVDGSARLQTVDARRHGRYHRLLERFENRTGCPMVLNTSFNVRGEPIVATPEDALRCFFGTEIDVLAIGDFVVDKAALGGAPVLPRGAGPSPERAAPRSAAGMVTAAALLGIVVGSRSGWRAGAIVFVVGCGLALAAWAAPGVQASLGRLLQPLRRFAGVVVLSAIHLIAIVPLGLLLRVSGRDPLGRRRDPTRSSYLSPKQIADDLESHLRQF